MDTRITIRLTRSQAERLEEMATRLQIPVAEVLRRALEHVTEADLAWSASAPEGAASMPKPLPRCAHPGQSLALERLLARIQARSPALTLPEGSSPAHEGGA